MIQARQACDSLRNVRVGVSHRIMTQAWAHNRHGQEPRPRVAHSLHIQTVELLATKEVFGLGALRLAGGLDLDLYTVKCTYAKLSQHTAGMFRSVQVAILFLPRARRFLYISLLTISSGKKHADL